MFKKLVYTLAAVGLLASCNEDFDNWTAPQSNQPEAAKTVTITATPAADINLADITDDSIAVATFAVSQPEGFVTDSIALDVDNPVGADIPLVVGSNNKVAVADLAQVVTDLYGVRPEQRTLTLAAQVYSLVPKVNSDSTVVYSRVASAPVEFKINVTPVRPAFEDAYYYIGALAQDKSYPLTEESDGVWSVTVPAHGGWHWFKIAPKSGFASDGSFDWANEGSCLCATSKDDEAASGKFVIGGDKNSWHLIEAEGVSSYKITVDLYEQTYVITPAD